MKLTIDGKELACGAPTVFTVPDAAPDRPPIYCMRVGTPGLQLALIEMNGEETLLLAMRLIGAVQLVRKEKDEGNI